MVNTIIKTHYKSLVKKKLYIYSRFLHPLPPSRKSFNIIHYMNRNSNKNCLQDFHRLVRIMQPRANKENLRNPAICLHECCTCGVINIFSFYYYKFPLFYKIHLKLLNILLYLYYGNGKLSARLVISLEEMIYCLNMVKVSVGFFCLVSKFRG